MSSEKLNHIEQEIPENTDDSLNRRITPEDIYFRNVGKISEQSSQERMDTAKKLDETRQRYRRYALRDGNVIRAVVRILKDVHEGKRRIDRTFRFPVSSSNPELKEEIRQMLAQNLSTLDGLFGRDREDLDNMRNTEKSSEERMAAESNLLARREREINLAEELPIRTNLVNDIIGHIHGEGSSGKASFIEEDIVTDSDQLNLLRREYESTRDDFATSNIRLVISIAKKYQGSGVSFNDLTQEGNKGLLSAVDNFDHTRGFQFSTYATWWIRQAMLRAIKKERRFENTLSIDDPTEYLTRRTLKNVHTENSEGLLENDRSLSDELQELLGRIPSREMQVISEYFGLKNGKPKILKEIGKEIGITKERVRQLKARGIRRLQELTSEFVPSPFEPNDA